MSNYELYEKVIEAFKGNDEGSFNAAARNWAEGANEVYFENNDANELFAIAKRCAIVWRSNAINSRVSKYRMIECIRKIAEMNLPNPYKKEYSAVDDIAAEVENKPEATHVFGVIPGFEQFEGKEETEKNKAPAEEEKPHFFGKRNKK